MPVDVQVVIAITTLLALLLVASIVGIGSRRRHNKAAAKHRAAIRQRAARVIR